VRRITNRFGASENHCKVTPIALAVDLKDRLNTSKDKDDDDNDDDDDMFEDSNVTARTDHFGRRLSEQEIRGLKEEEQKTVADLSEILGILQHR